MMSNAWHRLLSKIRKTLMRFEDERTETSSRFNFTIMVEPDELDGGYVAYMPGFQGCVGEGDTVEDALTNIMDALREIMIESLTEQNNSRAPHAAATRAPEEFKVAVGC